MAGKGDGRGRPGTLRSHFGITVGDVSIAYCYIRKNACSAWKRMFLEETNTAFDRAEWRREIAFMAAHHGLRTVADIERHDRRVVVVRDPVERYVSAFVSLMIAHSPPPTRRLATLSRRLIGTDVSEVSLDAMLEHQLPATGGRRRRRIEKHFWPQVWHLAPTTYTDVIDIGRLAAAMKSMLGEALGARYFDHPVNATAARPTYDDSGLAALPARVLRQRYLETGMLPSKASLLEGGREAAIRSAYAEDAALYAACQAHDRSGAGANMTLRVGPRPARPRKRQAGSTRR